MNGVIQAKLAGKQLKLEYDKCFQMHIGQNSICLGFKFEKLRIGEKDDKYKHLVDI